LEIAVVHEKSCRIDEAGSKSIGSAMKLLRQQQGIQNRTLLNTRILVLEQCLKAIPTQIARSEVDSVLEQGNMSPPIALPQSWPPLSTSTTSNTTFDFNFMRSARFSESSVAESVDSSFDPSILWTPRDRDSFSTSPETDSQNDILESFLSTILDEQNHTSQLYGLPGDSPTQLGLAMPNLFDINNSSFSDEDDGKDESSEISPNTYLPLFLGSFPSSESSPENQLGESFKFNDTGFPDCEGGHIHTAPNLFSEETGWAV
jgi:hypothetical protein